MAGSKRKAIEKIVNEQKVLSFTKIKDKTELSNGVLQYHINRSPEIEKEKGAVMRKDFCKECSFENDCQEKCLAKILQKPKNRQIIRMLEEKKNLTQISEELDIDISTAHYHVEKLESEGIIQDRNPSRKAVNYLTSGEAGKTF